MENITEPQEKNNLYNAALFIDYENVYKNLLHENRNIIRDGFFEKIRKWCQKNNRRLVKIAVYCNYDNQDLHESYHQSLLQSYGVESIHTSNQGKNFADLQITIDVLTAMHLNNNIDEFLIMSNDKDMTPLLNNIRYNKRKVSVITVGNKYNDAICSFSDEQIKYENIIEESVENLYIDTLQEKIKKNLDSYLSKNKSAFHENNVANEKEATTSVKFKHTGLEFFCENQARMHCLMLYEVYNCINNIVQNNDYLFYTYKYGSKSCIGICHASEREILKDICKEEDFFKPNIAKMRDDLYNKYRNPKIS